ncbi:MAG: YicC family protein [Nitrospiraceae bacterium]|nr:YicC family protein [Nitrospiraceae bacterium]
MLQGMTGFGSSEKGDFRVEVRSLNSRFLEINLKLPSGLMEQDILLRNIIKGRFARGKFDVFVTVRSGRQGFSLNVSKARQVYEAMEGLRRELSIPGQTGIRELAAMKDLFVSEESGQDAASIEGAFEEALSGAEAMRLREGRMIAEDIDGRIASLGRINGRMKELLPATLSGLKEKYASKIKSMLQETGWDEGRLLQEAAILAERADIAEELTRIAGHLDQMKKIIRGNDKTGRELDFLLQELHREANTIGSKTSDMEITARAIEFKTEVERIRQQAQNLQ